MRFLDRTAATAEIKRLVGLSKNVRMAVAFWGDGATEALGLADKGKAATIICNLTTGGTNPKEIACLMKNELNVRQCDTLHGKVYLFDTVLVVGSSNASANGLALQGAQLSGWHEANVLIEDTGIYRAASDWYDRLESREIKDDDLRKAGDAYEKRRRALSDNWKGRKPTLIDALKSKPANCRDKNFYICAYKDGLNEDQTAMVDDERDRSKNRNVGGFDWEIPKDATLICFWVGKKGGIQFDGFWDTSHKPYSRKLRRSEVWFAERLHKMNGLSKPGSGAAWKSALLDWDKEVDIARAARPHIRLEDFAGRYLKS